MPIKNAIHSQQVYDPTDESIMAGTLHGAAIGTAPEWIQRPLCAGWLCTRLECIQGGLFMLEHFFKSLVATVSDPYQCNRITDALAAAGIKFYCKSKDVNRHNTFDQARIGTLGIKPRYVTEVFVDKENADMALHIIHTLS
jgi:hypothetical protein